MSLAGRTKTALDELRMLMMGAQILLGFQFHAPFENAFGQLSSLEKKIEIVVLGTIMIVVGLLIAPSARHRILEQGEATPGINDYISRIAMVTLGPFALAMALDLGLAASRALGAPIGTVAGATGGAIALGFASLLSRHRIHLAKPLQALRGRSLLSSRVREEYSCGCLVRLSQAYQGQLLRHWSSYTRYLADKFRSGAAQL